MMMMMDRRRMMEDADGGGRVLVHRERRTRWLAVVVAVQNVLVTLSLVVTLYVYLDVKSLTARAEKTSEDNVHIRFHTISDISGNRTLQFSEVHSNNTMGLANENKDQIYVRCNGPYVLYMYLCYQAGLGEKASGILQLRVVGDETPVISIPLNASHDVCRGLQCTAYLRVKEMVSLHLYSSEGFKINNATVALSYMLGSRCDF
ncbi:uncharacterized protein LOC141768066 [Sebastes fasciatus]|uniref:uncharacterized protein LOC141768066 n=1 Tax=Sebastes fasciatus TaxID=394691 RepID=UPI003D9EBDEC